MTWTIHIRRGTQQCAHVTEELNAALAVASLLLRDGIEVEGIDGPHGAQLSVDVIRELTGVVEVRSQKPAHKRIGTRAALDGAGDLWKRLQAMLIEATTSHGSHSDL
jgi:hypothetical protein